MTTIKQALEAANLYADRVGASLATQLNTNGSITIVVESNTITEEITSPDELYNTITDFIDGRSTAIEGSMDALMKELTALADSTEIQFSAHEKPEGMFITIDDEEFGLITYDEVQTSYKLLSNAFAFAFALIEGLKEEADSTEYDEPVEYDDTTESAYDELAAVRARLTRIAETSPDPDVVLKAYSLLKD